MRLIWIVPKSPLGSPDGARQATGALLRHLGRLGAEIHIICLSPPGESVDAGLIRDRFGAAGCRAIARGSPWTAGWAGLGLPWTFKSFAAAGVRGALRAELARLLGGPATGLRTALVFDGLHAFAALSPSDWDCFSERRAVLVYRAHNFETALWEQYARASRAPLLGRLFRDQAARVKAFERRACLNANLIAPVSREDASRFSALVPGAAVETVPIGLDFPREADLVPVRESDDLKLLFVGRLDWPPNRDGLAWFLSKVWPDLLAARPGAELHIAGTGDSRRLRPLLSLPRLRFHGRVERLDPLYEACALSIAPIFMGSGTRVKILESGRFARAAVTTALGAEGTGLIPGRSCFQAQTAGRWLDLLSAVGLADCRAAGLRAFRELRVGFDAEAAAMNFYRTLRELSARRRAFRFSL